MTDEIREAKEALDEAFGDFAAQIRTYGEQLEAMGRLLQKVEFNKNYTIKSAAARKIGDDLCEKLTEAIDCALDGDSDGCMTALDELLEAERGELEEGAEALASAADDLRNCSDE